MRALILSTPKIPDSIHLSDLELPIPAKDQVRVRMTSMGLNRGDLLYCEDRYFFPSIPNSRLGFEGAGIIDALGENTEQSGFTIGDRVALMPMSFDLRQQGCFSEYGLYATNSLILSPANLKDDETGAIWMAYLTAWGGLFHAGKLNEKECVVITAASSSVGLAAIQLAKMHGARVIATSSHENKSDALIAHGADKVITCPANLSGVELQEMNDRYVAEVRQFTNGKGSDLVFDAVAGPATHGLVKASAEGGRIVIQGMLDRRPMDIHAGVLMKRKLSLKGYTLDETLNHTEQKNQAINCIRKGFEDTKLKATIASSYALDEFKQAFSELKRNQHIGKIVIKT